MRFKKIIALASAAAVLGSVLAAQPVSTAQETVLPINDASFTAGSVPAASADAFVLANTDGVVDIYVDPQGSEYDGLSLIADAFAGDVELVSGQKPSAAEDKTKLGKTAVIAGVIGENENGLISDLITSGKIDVSDIEGKWETYKIQVVENPTTDIERAIVIIGSDKRGTIYGIFHLSEMIGVSPWVYYGDVTPEHKDVIAFSPSELNITSQEPSVKYRGIFLNDEQPNLTSWTDKQFGGRNRDFYATMFEVILRLKGNYLWPAMWGDQFSKEGNKGLKDSTVSALASAELADKYGVVMGTSHHEPMARAGLEWSRERANYLPADKAALDSSATWDYFNYREPIYNFWKDGYERNSPFENVITIGMRGEADSSLGLSLSQSVQNLKNVITDQFEIMKTISGEVPPTMICLYKEVEQYWYGGTENGKAVEGLKDWKKNGVNPLDDTIVMLCDDNFGNLRTVPTDEDRASHDKWGMYYHFDYVGGPHTYKWIATNQLEKTWENMTAAYEYGIKDLWMVNVGDFKPMELNTSFFLDLAYDYGTYSKLNSTQNYYKTWAAQQFGYGAENGTTNAIAQILSDYLKMNGAKKPEKMFPDTFSLTDYNEAQIQLAKANDLYDRAWEYYEKVPPELKDAYYQLVLYPAAASANVERWCIYSGLNSMYAKEGSMLANVYAALVEECYALDISLQEEYNKINNGKWNGMMTRELHIGYNNYNSSYDNKNTTYVEPRGEFVAPEEDAADTLIVNTDTSTEPVKTSAQMSFSNLYKEVRAITVSHSQSSSFDYTASASADWIKLTKTGGTTNTGEVVGVSVDWSKVSATTTGTITISGLDSTVTITVNADVADVSKIEDGTVLPYNGAAAVLAEDYSAISDENDWILMENYGREKSSMKAADFTANYTLGGANTPWLEYKIYVDTAGDYYLTAYTAPTNSRTNAGKLPYGLSINSGAAYAVNTIAKRSVYDSTRENYYYLVDDGNSLWRYGCMDNVHVTTTKIALNKGVNTIRFMSLDSGTVLQKLVVSEGTAISNLSKVTAKIDAGADSEPYYYNDISSERGAVPTYITGSGAAAQQSLTAYEADDKQIVPGEVKEFTNGSAEIVISRTAPYVIKAEGTIDSAAQVNVTLKAATVSGTGASAKVTETEVTVPAKYDAAAQAFIAEPEEDIAQGAYTLSYTVTGDSSAKINSISLAANDGLSKIEVLNDVFSNASDAGSYAAYSDDGTLDSPYGTLQVSFTGDKTHGVKTDVTELVKGASGLTFGASADLYVTWTGGDSKIFIEVTDEEDNVVNTFNFTSSRDYDSDKKISLKGECDPVTFESGEKVYLCITQPSGWATFDNIKLWYYAEKVTEQLFLDDFSDESQMESYIEYDSSVSEFKTKKIEWGKLAVDYTEGWKAENGIKKDITQYVKDHSGAIFTASADFISYYYNKHPVKMFFEIVPGDGGSKQQVSLSTIETDESYTSGYRIEGMKGQSILNYSEGDTIYLCITHHSGTHNYGNIELSATYAKLPEPETTKKVNIFKHTFNTDKAAEVAMYEPYETAKGEATAGNNPVLKYTGGMDAENRGVKINVTDEIGLSAELSGELFGASANVKPGNSWSGANNVKLFFEVVTQEGEITTVELATVTPSTCKTAVLSDSETAADLSGNWLEAPITGESELTFKDVDTVYLCITSPTTNDMFFDDITMYYVVDLTIPEPTTDPGTQETPSPTPTAKPVFTVSSPVLDEDGAHGYITVTNTTVNSESIRIYTVKYDENDVLSAIHKTTAVAETGEINKKIAFDAEEGDAVFVWGESMKPLTEKTIIEKRDWVASWGSAQQEYNNQYGNPASPASGSIIRQRMIVSAGGDYMTLTLSNLYSDGPLTIDAVHLAKPATDADDGTIDLSTDTAVTFNGSKSVTIPKGATVTSDITGFSTEDFDKVVMTIYAKTVPTIATGHSGARTTTYIKRGGSVSDASMSGATKDEHWYFASEIDVLKPASDNYAAIAILGDSITDGYGATTNADNRWTDVLAHRLNEAGMKLTVINDGIGGNAISTWGLGKDGRCRYDNEVKNRTGIKYLIILEGINDIGGKTVDSYSTGSSSGGWVGDAEHQAADDKISTGVIDAYREIIEEAHKQGIKVIGGTIMPCGNNNYYNETMEEMRQKINAWIRTDGNFDDVIDFDALMRDSTEHSRLKAEYDCGDGLHPSPNGYKAMGDYINLSLFN